MRKILLLSFCVITISSILSFSIQLVFAWTEPSSPPPGGNVAAPLNISGTGQAKSGGLLLNSGGATYGLIVEKGNVGIGTASPDANLHVYGASGSSEIRLSRVGQKAVQSVWSYNGGAVEFGPKGSDDLILLGRNGTQTMTLTSGSVGIGTAGPNGKLDIFNTGANGDGAVFAPDINLDNNFTIQTYIDANLTGGWGTRTTYAGGCCNNLALQPDIGTVSVGGTSADYGSNKFNVIGNSYFSGNVGIGTAGPGAKLDVGNTDANTLKSVLARLGEGNTSGEGTYLGVKSYNTQPVNSNSFAIEHKFYGILNSAINFYRGGSATGGFMSFSTNNGTERVWINSDGNVRIAALANCDTIDADASGNLRCGNDGGGGGTVTSLSAGTGITLSPNPIITSGTISADFSTVQGRVTGTCSVGQSIRAIASDGTVTCEADDVGGSGSVTSISAGSNIVLSTNPNPITTSGSIAVTDNPSFKSLTVSGTKGTISTDPDGTTIYMKRTDSGNTSFINPQDSNGNAGTLSIGGSVSANSSGLYSYNGSSRSIGIRSNGGGNDLESVGADLYINWGGKDVRICENTDCNAYLNKKPLITGSTEGQKMQTIDFSVSTGFNDNGWFILRYSGFKNVPLIFFANVLGKSQNGTGAVAGGVGNMEYATTTEAKFNFNGCDGCGVIKATGTALLLGN